MKKKCPLHPTANGACVCHEKETYCRYCHTTPCQIEYKHDTSKTKLPQREEDCTCKNLAPASVHFKNCPTVTKLPQWEVKLSALLEEYANASYLLSEENGSEEAVAYRQDDIEHFIRKAIEQAYDEGYAVRGGVESEQKQRMYDAGVSVGYEKGVSKVIGGAETYKAGQRAEREAMIEMLEQRLRMNDIELPIGAYENIGIKWVLTALKARRETLI